MKFSAEEDEQNIFLKNLENCSENQPVDYAKQPIENLQRCELPKEWRILRDLSVENIIEQINKGVSTRRIVANFCNHMTFVSKVEPKSNNEVFKDEHWTSAMHEELNQFVRNDVWLLVPRTDKMNVIGTKWVFRNKSDDTRVITRNKTRLVAKGYN